MTESGDPPARFEDLEAVLSDAWCRLASAMTQRGAAFRTPILATVTEAGLPSARVVVLRAFDSDRRLFTIYTDVRSQKVSELARQPRASLVFYDQEDQIQLRCAGQVALHHRDEIARTAWAGTSAIHRRNYLATTAPGTPTAVPGPAAADESPTEPGEETFCVLALLVDSVDWVRLSDLGNRRARFAWQGDRRIEATWLVP